MHMETIEIFEISEEKLMGILNTLPSLWKERKEFLEPSLKLLFEKFGNKDDLLFAVQAFTGPSSIIALLTEYLRDLETASFVIYAYDLSGGGVTEAIRSETRLRDILEDYIEVDFSAFSHLKGDEIFVCPKCSARYRLRTLRLTRDGRVECQNCGRIVEYVPFEKGEDTNSNT
jgi:DNA-directed RNA polymerase subunit RPC12/RpoP